MSALLRATSISCAFAQDLRAAQQLLNWKTCGPTSDSARRTDSAQEHCAFRAIHTHEAVHSPGDFCGLVLRLRHDRERARFARVPCEHQRCVGWLHLQAQTRRGEPESLN